MKKLTYLLATVVALVAITGCGDDDPVIPRDRDIQFSTFELFHIDGEQPSISLEQCDITIHRQTTAADVTVKLSLDGSGAETFAMTGIALEYDADKNIYKANTATTSNARISDLRLTIDCNDYIADMSFKVDGRTVIGTSNEILFSKVGTTIAYRDSATYNYPHTRYMTSIRPNGMSASLSFGELLIKYENLMYANISVDGLKMEVTDNGYHLTGNGIETESGQYYSHGFTSSPITKFGDQLFVRFDNLQADVNVRAGSLSGSWTMVRLKRVTDTLQTTPELVTQQRVVEVSKTAMSVQGTVK